MAMRYYAPLPNGSGDPRWPGGPHALRIGDAERDAAAADLGEHYAAGRLTPDELDERLDAVFSAKTWGQLAEIMSDLPGPGRLARLVGPGTIPYGASRTTGFLDDAFFRAGAEPWHARGASAAGIESRHKEEPPTSSDQAGRVAALSLLLLAMLIWLFTALLFIKHGVYQGPYGLVPPGPYGHIANTLQVIHGLPANGPQSAVAP